MVPPCVRSVEEFWRASGGRSALLRWWSRGIACVTVTGGPNCGSSPPATPGRSTGRSRSLRCSALRSRTGGPITAAEIAGAPPTSTPPPNPRPECHTRTGAHLSRGYRNLIGRANLRTGPVWAIMCRYHPGRFGSWVRGPLRRASAGLCGSPVTALETVLAGYSLGGRIGTGWTGGSLLATCRFCVESKDSG